MGLLDFLGPLKPLIMLVIWSFILVSWAFAILITIFVPFAFFLTVPWMVILGAITIFALFGLYIGKKKMPGCTIIDDKLVCD